MPGGHEGHGSTIDEAVKNAWENAKGKPGVGPGEYDVKILAKCSNPVDGYRVIISRGGG